MGKIKNSPGKRKKSPQPKGTRRKKKVTAEPSTSKLRKARAKKSHTAASNISNFFPKDIKNNSDSEDIEEVNSGTDNEQATSKPVARDPDQSEQIQWRVKPKAARASIAPSQGTPFHRVKIQAEVYQAMSKRSSLQEKDHDKSMGNILGNFSGTPRNKDDKYTRTPVAERGTPRASAFEAESPYFHTDTTAMVEPESDDTDGSAVFDSNQRLSKPVATKKGRIKKRPAPEVSTAEEQSGGENVQLFGSPELVMSPKLPANRVEVPTTPPATAPPSDEDETQTLSPLQMIITDESGTLDVEEPVMDTNNAGTSQGFMIRRPDHKPQPRSALKRKVPEDQNLRDLPASKRRPIVFDFEPIPEDKKLHGRQSPVSPCRKLVNKKRLRHKYVDPRPRMYASAGTDPKKYAKTILQHFDDFREALREAQSRQTLCVPWGRPIIPGRHCAGTLDLMTRGQDLITNYGTMDNDDEDWSHVPKLAVRSRAHRGQSGSVDLLSRIQSSMDANNPTKLSRGIQLIPVPSKYDKSLPQASNSSPTDPSSRLPRRGRLARKVAPRLEEMSIPFEDDSNEENAFEMIPKSKRRRSTKDIDQDYIPETQDMFGDFSPPHSVSGSERELPEESRRNKSTGVEDDAVTVVADSQPMSPPDEVSPHKLPTTLNDAVLRSVSSRLSSEFRDKQATIAANIKINVGKNLPKKTVMDLSDLDGSGSNYDDAFLGESKQLGKDPIPNKIEAAQLIERISKVSNKKVVRKKKQPLHILDEELFDSEIESESAATEVKVSHTKSKTPLSTHQDDVRIDDITDQAMDGGANDKDNNVTGHTDDNPKSGEQPASTRKRLGQRNPRKKPQEPTPHDIMVTVRALDDQARNIGEAGKRNSREPMDPVQVGTTRGLRRQNIPGNKPHEPREIFIDTQPKQQKVEKKIACPMCFKKFTEAEIEAHAFTCEGEPENEDPIPEVEPTATAPHIPANQGQPQRRTTRTPSKTSRELDPDPDQRPGPSRPRETQVTHGRGSASQRGTPVRDRQNSEHGQRGRSAAGSPVKVCAERSPDGSFRTFPQATETVKDPTPVKTSPKVVPTSVCPMCNAEVPCDTFMDHVTSCVDRAEALNAAKQEDGPNEQEADGVLQALTRRPLRRRPLHSNDT